MLFLNIQIPHINNLKIIKILNPKHHPYIIFLTTFNKYTIKTFKKHTFNYLLKPINKTQLKKTLTQLHQKHNKQNISLLPKNQQTLKFIPYTKHNQIYLLQIKNITFINNQINNIYITNHKKKKNFTKLTLHTLKNHTPLLHYHHQYLINLTHLQKIHLKNNNQTKLILHNNLTIPINHHYLKNLKKTINL